MPESTLDLEELRRLVAELEMLPPRPWRAGIGGYAYDDEGRMLVEVSDEDAHVRDYVVEAVVAFTNALPAILATLERAERVEVAGPSEVVHMRELLTLQAELDELRAEVRAYCDMLLLVGIGPPDAEGGFPRIAEACSRRAALAAASAEEGRDG